MKRLLIGWLVILVVSLLSVSGWAREGGKPGKKSSEPPKSESHHWKPHLPHLRSNKDAKKHGKERAEEVQQNNKRADSRRGFSVAPGVEKAETHKGGTKKK